MEIFSSLTLIKSVWPFFIQTMHVFHGGFLNGEKRVLSNIWIDRVDHTLLLYTCLKDGFLDLPSIIVQLHGPKRKPRTNYSEKISKNIWNLEISKWSLTFEFKDFFWFAWSWIPKNFENKKIPLKLIYKKGSN